MLRTSAVLSVLLLFLGVSAVAQEYPRAEVFGGYSYLHIDTQGVNGSTLDAECNNLLGAGTCPPGTFQVHKNFNGWNAAAQYNVTDWLGLKADFSGHYGKPVTLSSSAQSLVNTLGITGFPPSAQSYSFLFGPVLSNRRARFKPFAHALFGANRVSSSLNIQVPGFSIPGITVSDTAFAMAFGGGLDIKATDRFWIRVGQGDYLFTKHDFSGGVPGIATHQNNFRASAGVVFMIGGRSTPASTVPPVRVARAAMPIPALGIAVSPRGDGKDGAEITEVAPGGVGRLRDE